MKPGKALMTCYAVVLMSLNSLAQNTPMTLKQCVDTAIANNLDVIRKDLQSQRERITLKQNRDNIIPTLGANIDHTAYQGRSIDPVTNSYVQQSYTSAGYSAGTDVTLFNGFRLINNIKSAQFAWEASRMELQQQKDQLMLDVILAYLDILTNEDLVEQSQKQLEVSRKQVERLDIMNKEGAIKPSDLFDLKGQYSDNKIALITNQNNLNRSKLALAQLMNKPYSADLTVEKLTAEQFAKDYAGTADGIYAVALEQMAIVKAADLRVKSAEKNVKATRGGLFPTVGFGAGINTNFSSLGRDANNVKLAYYDQLSNNYRTNFGVGISIPILNNFRVRNNLALAKIDLKDFNVLTQTMRIQLKQNIERDHLNMEASLNKYNALLEQVASYAESFRVAEVRFNEGASTSVDYVIAKNNLDRANINLIIARYDYVLRTKILDYYQGKMLYQ